MVDVAGLLDHIAGCVIQIGVEFGLLHHSQRLLLQEFDLFRDDAQLAPSNRSRALVRLLHLYRITIEGVNIGIPWLYTR